MQRGDAVTVKHHGISVFYRQASDGRGLGVQGTRSGNRAHGDQASDGPKLHRTNSSIKATIILI
jgi:hypothetical protein